MLGWVGTQVHVNVLNKSVRSRLYHFRLFLPFGTATSEIERDASFPSTIIKRHSTKGINIIKERREKKTLVSQKCFSSRSLDRRGFTRHALRRAIILRSNVYRQAARKKNRLCRWYRGINKYVTARFSYQTLYQHILHLLAQYHYSSTPPVAINHFFLGKSLIPEKEDCAPFRRSLVY